MLIKLYETCFKGKFAISPNYNATITRYIKYRNHITLDLYGPILKIAFKGFKYLYTLLDTTTKWLDYSLLKTKKETLEVFKKMKITSKNQTSQKIKILRTDWGKEFINLEFNAYLIKCGIAYKYSTPYAYEQNGAAERINWTILERVRYLLFQYRLSTNYQLFIAEAAIYLYNHTWHSTISQTPFKARFGKKPNITNIQLFGFIAYIKNPKPKKLQERASYRGILIEFGENQYKILNLETDKVYWLYDVNFLEGTYFSTNSIKGGYLDFNQIFKNL